jgi:sugar (pentulose or hexulose) kinase
MALLAVDIGTTHCKAAAVRLDGTLLKLASSRMETSPVPGGHRFYDPLQLWKLTAALIHEAASGAGEAVTHISVTGMAEAGLYVDRDTKEPLTWIIPWFDGCTKPLFAAQKHTFDSYERFTRTGLRNHYKFSLYKMQWLLEHGGVQDRCGHLQWLQVPEYIVSRLCGRSVTDPTLAARTYLFDIFRCEWVDEYFEAAGLSGIAMPEILPSGAAAAPLSKAALNAVSSSRLSAHTLAVTAGHDHICAAAAVGAAEPGAVYDSAGTAETLMAEYDMSSLGQKEYAAGFSFGRHTVGDRFFWLASVAASGGSFEWMRGIIGEGGSSYERTVKLLEELPAGPTGILYFPYLTGSNAPVYDPSMSAAFIGLLSSHTPADLMKAVCEGVCYEAEWILTRVREGFHPDLTRLLCGGGGVRNRSWMQIKADITGLDLYAAEIEEATLLGAAWTAALRAEGDGGVRLTEAMMREFARSFPARTYVPNPRVSVAYRKIFEERYLPLQKPLRRVMGADMAD